MSTAVDPISQTSHASIGGDFAVDPLGKFGNLRSKSDGSTERRARPKSAQRHWLVRLIHAIKYFGMGPQKRATAAVFDSARKTSDASASLLGALTAPAAGPDTPQQIAQEISALLQHAAKVDSSRSPDQIRRGFIARHMNSLDLSGLHALRLGLLKDENRWKQILTDVPPPQQDKANEILLDIARALKHESARRLDLQWEQACRQALEAIADIRRITCPHSELPAPASMLEKLVVNLDARGSKKKSDQDVLRSIIDAFSDEQVATLAEAMGFDQAGQMRGKSIRHGQVLDTLASIVHARLSIRFEANHREKLDQLDKATQRRQRGKVIQQLVLLAELARPSNELLNNLQPAKTLHLPSDLEKIFHRAAELLRAPGENASALGRASLLRCSPEELRNLRYASAHLGDTWLQLDKTAVDELAKKQTRLTREAAEQQSIAFLHLIANGDAQVSQVTVALRDAVGACIAHLHAERETGAPVQGAGGLGRFLGEIMAQARKATAPDQLAAATQHFQRHCDEIEKVFDAVLQNIGSHNDDESPSPTLMSDIEHVSCVRYFLQQCRSDLGLPRTDMAVSPRTDDDLKYALEGVFGIAFQGSFSGATLAHSNTLHKTFETHISAPTSLATMMLVEYNSSIEGVESKTFHISEQFKMDAIARMGMSYSARGTGVNGMTIDTPTFDPELEGKERQLAIRKFLDALETLKPGTSTLLTPIINQQFFAGVLKALENVKGAQQPKLPDGTPVLLFGGNCHFDVARQLDGTFWIKVTLENKNASKASTRAGAGLNLDPQQSFYSITCAIRVSADGRIIGTGPARTSYRLIPMPDHDRTSA